MKNLSRYILVALCLILGVAASAQTLTSYGTDAGSERVFIPIAKYLGHGDIDNLSAWMSETVDMTIGSTEGVFSKVQAKEVLKTFVESYPPQSMKEIQTSSSGALKYALYEMQSGRHTFMVSLSGMVTDGEFKLLQIRVTRRLER